MNFDDSFGIFTVDVSSRNDGEISRIYSDNGVYDFACIVDYCIDFEFYDLLPSCRTKKIFF